MKTLTSIGLKHNTDKSIFGYLEIYNDLFQKYQDNKNTILAEVGILSGSSLKTWREFLPKAKIIGIDNTDIGYNTRNEYVSSMFFNTDNNSRFVLCDQSDKKQLKKFVLEIISNNEEIDIFIDDGSHFQHDIMITLEEIFPIIKSGGLYIIEDICTVENLTRGDSWWGCDSSPSIENSVEYTFINYLKNKIINNKYLTNTKYLEDNIENCFFYKAMNPPLTSQGTSSLVILVKK
jgi:hypothetical protein